MGQDSQLHRNITVEPFEENETTEFLKSNLKEFLKPTELTEITTDTELNELVSLFHLNQEKQRPVTLEKLTALLKLKLDTANDFKSVIEEFKQDKWKLEDELFKNLTEREEKAWQILKHCSYLHPDFSPISITRICLALISIIYVMQQNV